MFGRGTEKEKEGEREGEREAGNKKVVGCSVSTIDSIPFRGEPCSSSRFELRCTRKRRAIHCSPKILACPRRCSSRFEVNISSPCPEERSNSRDNT